MWGEEMEGYLGLWGLPLLEGINVALMRPQLVPRRMSCYKKDMTGSFSLSGFLSFHVIVPLTSVMTSAKRPLTEPSTGWRHSLETLACILYKIPSLRYFVIVMKVGVRQTVNTDEWETCSDSTRKCRNGFGTR